MPSCSVVVCKNTSAKVNYVKDGISFHVGQLDNMLRLSLFCVVAGLAVVSAIDLPDEWRSAVPKLPYSENLRVLKQAVDRLKQRVLPDGASVVPPVTDPNFHYTVIVGLLERAGNRMYEYNLDVLPPLLVFLVSLNLDLPEVYRNISQTQQNLLEAAANTTDALKPLLDLKSQYCGKLDEEDCDKVLEYKVQHQTPPNLDLLEAVAVLEPASDVANKYLKLHEEILSYAYALNSFGYLSVGPRTPLLSDLAKRHSDVLVALNDLQ